MEKWYSLDIFIFIYILLDYFYYIITFYDIEGMNSPDIRGLENFEVVYFPVAELFWNFREKAIL